MRLLIFTQVIDTEDTALSFFHRWVEELATRFDSIIVVCLKEGRHHLPKNVTVYSLGKETKHSRVQYIRNFYRYAWSLRNSYDTVFVHMNEEYVLLGGWLWWLLRKPVMLWRNYHAGTLKTDIAMFFCAKIFCTSRFSYTARSKKTVILPVGVDTKRFSIRSSVTRTPHSILFFSGMWESKRPEMLIDALEIIYKKGILFTAHFYGSPLPDGDAYYQRIQNRSKNAGLSEVVSFFPGIPNSEAPNLYRAHEIFVNCSPSGMFDKAMFEAAACGCRVLAISDDFAALSKDPDTHFNTTEELADRLVIALKKGPLEAIPEYVEASSLSVLADQLQKVID